jgi:hypothetical protein
VAALAYNISPSESIMEMASGLCSIRERKPWKDDAISFVMFFSFSGEDLGSNSRAETNYISMS